MCAIPKQYCQLIYLCVFYQKAFVIIFSDNKWYFIIDNKWF